MDKDFKTPSTRNDAVKNRIKIRLSAIAVLKDKGINATIEEIADHAGVGVGTIYRNFGSKNELIYLIASEVMDEIYHKQLEVVSSDLPIENKLSEIFATYLHISKEYGELHQMIIQLLTSPEEPNPLKDEWLQNLQSLYHQIIVLGQKEGIFSNENTLLQEKILISVVNPIMVKEISSVIPIDEAAIALSKFALNGLIIRN